MGKNNEHKSFLITEIKKTHTTLTPSIEMSGRTIRRHNILEAHRISIIANQPTNFPDDPEENEVTLKDNQLWIYSRVNNILEWRPLGGGGGGVIPDNVPAGNIIEDSDHRFVNNIQLQAIQEVVNGLIPAPKIIQDVDHQFLNQDQVNAVNNLIDGVEVDGGDIV